MRLRGLLTRRWLLRLLILTASILLVAGAIGLLFCSKYPGFVSDMAAEFRSATYSEFVDQCTYLAYYGKYYGRLDLNAESGLYDFGRGDGGEHEDAFERGKLAYHAGDFEVAARLIAEDVQARGESESKLFWQALANQRLAEASNCAVHCIEGESAGYCCLPLRKPHRDDRRPAQEAVSILRRLLDHYDAKNSLYRWLLNFSYMTLGEYPDSVPDRYRITGGFIDTFYGDQHQTIQKQFHELAFVERAAELKVNTNDAGKGVAVEDFDRDGYLDIVTGGTFSALKYYKNLGGRSFVDRTEEAGLAGVTQAYIITAADYDNDGWIDLFVSRPFHRCHLFRNTANGEFEDVTFQTGVVQVAPKSNEAVYTCVTAWGDVNNDGYLDLFMAQFGQRIPFTRGLLARRPMSSRLLVNVAHSEREPRRRAFRDVTKQYGLSKIVADRIFLGAAFGDFDNDGWTDLFLSSYFGARSVLLKNVRGQTYEPTKLVRTSRTGFTTAFLDIDHDGQLDLFHAGHGPARSVTESVVSGNGSTRSATAVFRQRTDGTFEERFDVFRNGMPIGTMGTSYGDLNNDGAFDFYLGTGNPQGSFVLPNLLYVGETMDGQCTGFFHNASSLHAFGTIQKGHGIVFFDFDNDGDQDIYSSLGGMWPGDSWPNQMFVNESSSRHHWLRLRLRGHKTNYYGVGARIHVVATRPGGHTTHRRHQMDNKTGFGSAPYIAHIGLSDAANIERVEVYWPVTKTTASYRCEVNHMYILDENGNAVLADSSTDRAAVSADR